MALDDIETARSERGLDRLLALSDGVFAFAITLLALDIVLPASANIESNGELMTALGEEVGSFVNFMVSFLVVGVYWVGHNRIFGYIRRVDNRLLWINIVFLLFIVLVPFGTRVLDAFGSLQAAVAVYAAINVGAGLMNAAIWRHASKGHRLIDGDIPGRTVNWLQARGLLAAAVFAASIPLSYVVGYYALVAWLLLIPILIVADRRVSRRP